MLVLQSLKAFINQRLSMAVDEVIGHLERTLTEYEAEMQSRCRKLPDRPPGREQRQRRRSAAVQQQVLIKEEVPDEQDQEDPGDALEKEERHDFWRSKKVVSRLQGVHEQDNTPLPFSFSYAHVKSEYSEDSSHFPHHYQRHAEENRKEEPSASGSAEQIKTEADGADCEKSEPQPIVVSCLSGADDKFLHCSEAEIKDSLKGRAPKDDMECTTTNKPFICSKCGKRFGQKHHLLTHMRCHTGEKPFCCSLCGKRFTQKGNLTQHTTVHTQEKPCSCPVCGERFAQKGNLTQHLTVHAREKLCW